MPHSGQMILASNNSGHKVATRCHMIRQRRTRLEEDRRGSTRVTRIATLSVRLRIERWEKKVTCSSLLERMYEVAAAESESHAVDVLQLASKQELRISRDCRLISTVALPVLSLFVLIPCERSPVTTTHPLCHCQLPCMLLSAVARPTHNHHPTSAQHLCTVQTH